MDDIIRPADTSTDQSLLSVDERREPAKEAVDAADAVVKEARLEGKPSQCCEESAAVAPPPEASVAAEDAAQSSQAEPLQAEQTRNDLPLADPVTGEEVPADLPQARLPQGDPVKPVQPKGGATKPEKGEPTRAEMDLTFTEAARSRDEYLDYKHDRFEDDKGRAVDLFAARRIGLSHIRKGMPCQDACAYEKISHGLVLLNADGISACKFGEVGSRLACETAGEQIERLSRETPDESDFIRALMSADFYRGLREAWVKRLKAHHEKEVGTWESRSLYDYGTTLLFAVLTERWIATLNLGDGQILVFNEGECQYARLAEKEGPAPKSLIYGTYLEDVQRGLWSRARYRGVLLTTDGVNDLLDRIPSFEGRTSGYNYALQIESRFMEKSEPYQPFVYTGTVLGMKRTIDLSRQRGASDDCSVVLAIDGGYASCDEGVAELLKKRYGQDAFVHLLRRTGDRACYLVKVDETLRMVYQVPASDPLKTRDPRLNDSRAGNLCMWDCESPGWVCGNLRFCSYLFPQGVQSQTLEASFQCADFNTVRQFHKTEDPITGEIRYVVEPLLGERVLKMYDTLTALEDHLAAQNLYLQTGAPFWIVMLADEDDTLLVPWEALSECPASEAAPWQLDIKQLFPGLIGRLHCREHSAPLFAPGNDDLLDVDYYLFDATVVDMKERRFFKIRYDPAKGKYGLMNTGVNAWSIVRADGTTREVEPGKTALMMDGDQIDVKVGSRKYSYQIYLR